MTWPSYSTAANNQKPRGLARASTQVNRSYVNGRRREYKAIALLREAGFECIRAAGSKGHFDIVAWNNALVKFGQVKTNPPTQVELESLKQALLPRSVHAAVEVWIFRRNKPLEIMTIP